MRPPRGVHFFEAGSGETCLSRFKGGRLCPLPPHHLATLYVCSCHGVNYMHYVCLSLSPSNPLSLDMIATASIHILVLLNPVTSSVFPLPSGLDLLYIYIYFSSYCVIFPSQKFIRKMYCFPNNKQLFFFFLIQLYQMCCCFFFACLGLMIRPKSDS